MACPADKGASIQRSKCIVNKRVPYDADDSPLRANVNAVGRGPHCQLKARKTNNKSEARIALFECASRWFLLLRTASLTAP